jgi:hypothetical protein
LLKSASKITAIILAALLIATGLIFIIYGTTTGYSRDLHHFATIETQQTQSAEAAVQSRIQATTQSLATAQANIEASATVEANATAQANTIANDATATATAEESALSAQTNGVAAFNDSLSDHTGKGKWDQGGTDYNSGCSFENASYHARETQQGYLQPCIAQNTAFSDFTYQVSVTINEGEQGQAGMLFRINGSNDAFYFFHIGTDGTYTLDRYNGNGSTLLQGFSSALNQGIGQQNQLTVIAHTGTLMLFANQQYLNTYTENPQNSENTLTAGKIGVGVIDASTPIDATFSSVQVWQYQSHQN